MASPALPPPRRWWVRALYIVLMALAFQLAVSVLVVVAVVQLVLLVALDAANPRLAFFGRSLALYLSQVAEFESFASEALPFPLTDWPSPPPTPPAQPSTSFDTRPPP